MDKKSVLDNIKKFYTQLFDILQEVKNSKNRIHLIIKHKNILSGVFAIFTLIFGFIGFSIEGKLPFDSILSTISMFGLDFPSDFGFNIFIFLAGICAVGTLFLLAVVYFLKDYFEKKIIEEVFTQNYTAIFGLGSINRAFLQSDFQDKEILIIDANGSNNYIEEYKSKNFGVIIGDIFSNNIFQKLNFETMEKAVIALGNDRLNIELAVKIIDEIKEKNINSDTRLIVHIANSELKALFHKNFINPQNDETLKIDVKTFSFFEECSKDLFDNHLPITKKYIDKDKPFSTVISGEGQLSLAILQDILLLSNFPNQNQHTIYLLSKNASSFYKKAEMQSNYSQEKFPTVHIKVLDLDPDEKEFYNQTIFKEENLLNVYICYDDEETNLNIAINLHERVYLRHKNSQAKIYFGMFDEYALSEKISSNRDFFDRFYTFGNNIEIFSKEKLLDEENYLIAKMTHNGYGDEFKRDSLVQNIKELDEKWFKTSKYSDKLSNISQSKHIDIKLLYLGFKKVKSSKDKKNLLESNQKLFDKVMIPLMEEVGLDYELLYTYSLELEKVWNEKDFKIMYMPETYETKFEKLINTEHERWNSYHYQNGWDYNENKDKEMKLHNCLKPLDQFIEPELQITLIYDIYSILYIPNYLASAGWELEEIE